MSSFFVFLDDIAVLAKAAAASIDDIAAGASKAVSSSAAVVIDDAAVTPQYVQDISPARELPIVAAIAKRSIINKAIIVVAIMILSALAPWIFPWALVIGGCYLTFEGAEKIIHHIKHRNTTETAQDVVDRSPKDEKTIVNGAATTDFVLSTEIMLIANNALVSNDWFVLLVTLIVVAILMTLLVYGSVGVLIKVDDAGKWLTERGAKKGSSLMQSFGVSLVKIMPKIFTLLTIVGVAAMLWVGGHLLIVNLAEVGLPVFYEVVHELTAPITHAALLWCADTLISACFGVLAGALLVGCVNLIKIPVSYFKKSETVAH